MYRAVITIQQSVTMTVLFTRTRILFRSSISQIWVQHLLLHTVLQIRTLWQEQLRATATIMEQDTIRLMQERHGKHLNQRQQAVSFQLLKQPRVNTECSTHLRRVLHTTLMTGVRHGLSAVA